MSTGDAARQIVTLRWITRASSVAISGSFLFILFLALTNEDKPQGPAAGVLALVVVALAACLAAWRWEQAGGVAIAVCAVGLGGAAYSVSSTVGLGSPSLLPALVYAVPFFVVGTLFWVCGQWAASASKD